MTRLMYDSVNVNSVPTGAQLYAGYIDGAYANVAGLRKRFPKTPVVTITVVGTAGAHVCDCETGDLTPPHAATWALTEIQAGRHPTIYCNASTWPTVEAEVRMRRIDGKVSYWIAHYDGNPVIPAGAVAKQYLGDHPNGHGGTYDASTVVDYWPGVDPAPQPQPPGPRYRKVTLTVIAAAKLRRTDVLTYIGQQVGRTRVELLAINATAPWRHRNLRLGDQILVRTG